MIFNDCFGGTGIVGCVFDGWTGVGVDGKGMSQSLSFKFLFPSRITFPSFVAMGLCLFSLISQPSSHNCPNEIRLWCKPGKISSLEPVGERCSKGRLATSMDFKVSALGRVTSIGLSKGVQF